MEYLLKFKERDIMNELKKIPNSMLYIRHVLFT